MFEWLRRKPPPQRTKASVPGIGATARVAFANGEKTWTEEFNVVSAASEALSRTGHEVLSHETWLEHCSTWYSLHPRLVELHPLENGGVRTVTTLEIRHPRLVPSGIFEFQHATGDTSQESVISGLEQWAKLDFVPLLDALRETPALCMVLEMTLPESNHARQLKRRAVLGPVAHYAQRPAAADDATRVGDEAEHPFCPCCLLTTSFEAFKSLLSPHDFCGIRLYAARNEHGQSQADCRVNGQDWEAGKKALCEYVTGWPERGFEFRKQYVVLQSLNTDVNK